jgi:glutamate dehydrogenase/leucine dehydrogenase
VSINVLPFLLDHPEYMEAEIFGRLTEPDRIIIFRVAWQDDEGKSVVVSGSGNVALYAVEKLIELGAKPVTLSDSSSLRARRPMQAESPSPVSK